MIKYRKGNLLDVTEGVIVHGCNMQSVMGSGVAKAIKDKYPACFSKYKLILETEECNLGDDIMYKVNDDLYICNALTQWSFGRGVRQVNYAAIVKVFSRLFNDYRDEVVHFPKIGAGLGGGDWGIIEQLINDCDPDNLRQKICWEL
jgi:O-acetyl-ADP-ribose deacetylase (regulator of RNase III)